MVHGSHEWPNFKGVRFTPYAWQKLLFMLHNTHTEVGAWGVSSKDDLLLVHDICVIKQKCTPASVEFDTIGMSDYLCDMAELGYEPSECMRIWIHTHPGFDPNPSATDLQTMADILGKFDWGIMLIVNARHDTTARLVYKAGPQVDIQLRVNVDWRYDHCGSDEEAWKKELDDHVEMATPTVIWVSGKGGGMYDDDFQSYRSYDHSQYQSWYRQEVADMKTEPAKPIAQDPKRLIEDANKRDPDTGLTLRDTSKLELSMRELGLSPPDRKLEVWEDVAMYLWDYTFNRSPAPAIARFPKDLSTLDGIDSLVNMTCTAKGQKVPDLFSQEWWDQADKHLAHRRQSSVIIA